MRSASHANTGRGPPPATKAAARRRLFAEQLHGEGQHSVHNAAHGVEVVVGNGLALDPAMVVQARVPIAVVI